MKNRVPKADLDALERKIKYREAVLKAVHGFGGEPLTLEQLREMNGRPVWWWNKSQKPTVTICLVDRFVKEPSFVSYDFVAEDATKISKYSLIRRWGYLPYASDPATAAIAGRLAAYEETGLTPEKVVELKARVDGLCK